MSFMSMIEKGFGYAGMSIGFANSAYSRGVRKIGSANMATLAGAGAGALYGGASSDTSIMGGALMGAGMGRYGRAFATGAGIGFRSGYMSGMRNITGPTSGMQRLGIGAMRGTAGAYGQVNRDFRSMMNMGRKAARNIGPKLRSNQAVR